MPRRTRPVPLLPEGFRFGVATSGFQVEGGYNAPGQPANNWVRWERAGRVERSGMAVDFWNRYEEHLDRAAAMGCDAFRLSVEWARVEPSEGDVDGAALDRYADIIDACHERGLEPLVTLHHFTHPAWLGEDFWLSPSSPARFASWVELAVGRLGSRCRHWVTINEINALGVCSYLLGMFPPGRVMHSVDMGSAFGNLLAAHVAAYDVLHAARPDAVVTTNNASMSIYELDRMLVDVLLARSMNVTLEGLGAWLALRRMAWYAELPTPGPLERGLRRASERMWAGRPGSGGLLPGLGRGAEAVWAGAHPCSLDVVGIDYYDPTIANHAHLPGHRTAGGRSWAPAAELWDDKVNPSGLVTYCRANGADGLGVWVVENGLCNRVRRGRSFNRLDGWDRARYLRENVAAVVVAVDAGLPVGAYYHWSLVDNYEWGSYEPRFGIHGVDRDAAARVLDTDAMGTDAAATYRRIIAGVRAGDRSVLAAG